MSSRYLALYDSAAEGYRLAIKQHNRANAVHWKKRIEWLDRMLKMEGEQ